MDRLRRSIRQSFRRSKKSPSLASPGESSSSSQPTQWQGDESAVRAASCSFQVKYLGSVEVFESRGMQICEEALKQLRGSGRKSQRAILHISGDGLRVVDATSSQLILDQTIEKVSFCAPDRNHDRGFSYICREGATRRWLCHGFVAVRESGERLSHAVGCAFQICLEKKQKRDRESSQPTSSTLPHSNTEMATVHSPTHAFLTPVRSASSAPLTGHNGNGFHQQHATTPSSLSSTASSTSFIRQSTRTSSIAERMKNPQEYKASSPPPAPNTNIVNPHARDRPHVTQQMLQRQQSLRAFSTLNSATPFKRNMSLQTREEPEFLTDGKWRPGQTPASSGGDAPSLPAERHFPRTNYVNSNVPTWEDGSPILDSDVLSEEAEESMDEVSRLCQQMSFDLSTMTAGHQQQHYQNGDHFQSNGRANSSGGPSSYNLPKSVSLTFPPAPERKSESAREARERFAERSPFTRTVHPPSVNGQLTNGGAGGHRVNPVALQQQKQATVTVDWNDPFNADWVSVQKNSGASTNPFLV
ncbi:Protein numb [Hypsibius exemplaris]|uniref:Protein numb n=1 Tax=Hypsibius exemplaris TaxID=2072580 RepID=A0A1W0XAR3_HYPEX|nr:Protein numb [Hypsibius exemplaris]